MFDFRSKTPSPDYHGRRSRRLLMLVGGLGLVIYAMWHAKDPKNWRWIEFFTRPRVAEVDTTAPADSRGDDLPDAFVSSGKRKALTPDAGKPLQDRVQPELLQNVEDNVAGFRAKEADAFFHLLEILKQADPEALRSAPAEKVSYLQLWSQSAEYRGRMVSIAGTIKRALPQKFPANDYGLSQYFEVWMRPEGAYNPVVIYALELPADFPRGTDLDEPGSITGFYYRRWWYLAGDEKKPATRVGRLAPMLLSRSIDWSPPPVPTREQYSGLGALVGVACGAALAIALGVIFVRRYSRDTRLPDYVRTRTRVADFDAIPDDAGKPDIRGQLSKLSQDEDHLNDSA